MSVIIRPFEPRDAEAVGRLMEDLDYPLADVATVLRRLGVVQAGLSHAVLVAENDDAIVGWVHVHRVPSLIVDDYAEVAALVVDHRCQRMGIGRQLLAEAESWAVAAGLDNVRLRSATHREDAHRFYEGMNYTKLRAAYSFKKLVTGNIKEGQD
jgi:GNAT superfamily N-acetyltransferase